MGWRERVGGGARWGVSVSVLVCQCDNVRSEKDVCKVGGVGGLVIKHDGTYAGMV